MAEYHQTRYFRRVSEKSGPHALQPLVKKHLRSVARGTVPGIMLVFVGVIASIGPWSPLALGWADALASRGADDAAAVVYLSLIHI